MEVMVATIIHILNELVISGEFCVVVEGSRRNTSRCISPDGIVVSHVGVEWYLLRSMMIYRTGLKTEQVERTVDVCTDPYN